jgi:cytochrome P450
MKCLVAVLVARYMFEEVEVGRVVEKEAVITYRPKGGMPLRIRKWME